MVALVIATSIAPRVVHQNTKLLESALEPAFLADGKWRPESRTALKKDEEWFFAAFGIEVETVAVMREPVDQIRSWFKYRKSERR